MWYSRIIKTRLEIFQSYSVIMKRFGKRFERVREEAEDAFLEITNVWSARPISIVRVIARPITIGWRYCWLGVASRDFGTPVASAASEAHDIKLHAHEDKVREEVHAYRRVRARARARTQMSLAMTTVRLALYVAARGMKWRTRMDMRLGTAEAYI